MNSFWPPDAGDAHLANRTWRASRCALVRSPEYIRYCCSSLTCPIRPGFALSRKGRTIRRDPSPGYFPAHVGLEHGPPGPCRGEVRAWCAPPQMMSAASNAHSCSIKVVDLAGEQTVAEILAQVGDRVALPEQTRALCAVVAKHSAALWPGALQERATAPASRATLGVRRAVGRGKNSPPRLAPLMDPVRGLSFLLL